MKKQTYTILTILLFFSINTFAQSAGNIVTKHLKALRKGESSILKKSTLEPCYTDATVLNTLEAFYKDKKVKVQDEALRLTGLIGSRHQDPEQRQKAVFLLMSEVKTAVSTRREKLAKGLQKFKVEDFGAESKVLLNSVLRAGGTHIGEFFKIGGFLKEKIILQSLVEEYKKKEELKQQLEIALIRSGDEKKKELLMSSLKEQVVNDDFIYGAVPALVYVRTKRTTDFLFDIILDDNKNCAPSGPDVGGKILCAYRVMEAIAPYIVDFPVQVGASGDLDVEDYEEALKTVRTWIEVHRLDYVQKEDIY